MTAIKKDAFCLEKASFLLFSENCLLRPYTEKESMPYSDLLSDDARGKK